MVKEALLPLPSPVFSWLQGRGILPQALGLRRQKPGQTNSFSEEQTAHWPAFLLFHIFPPLDFLCAGMIPVT